MKTLTNLVVACALLVGCRSKPGRYYTLLPPADRSAPAASDLQIEILPVEVPADVDRNELVVRKGRGEVAPAEQQSWISPLPLEIRRAFADVLARKLGARDVTNSPTAKGTTYRVRLDVQRFESMLGDRALIDATWTVRATGTKDEPLTCTVRIVESARAGYDGLVEAHQRALARIADRVAAGVRSVADGAPACPEENRANTAVR